MTLKVRLAAMMVLLLMAVMALQYLLTAREQREVAQRLSRLSGQVDAATQRLAEHAFDLRWRDQAGADTLAAAHLAKLRATLGAEADSTAKPSGDRVKLSMIVLSDSVSTTLRRGGPEHAGRGPLPAPLLAELDSLLPGSRHQILVQRVASAGSTATGHTEVTTQLFISNDSTATLPAARDLVFTIPLTTLGNDSMVAVKMRYPLDELTSELERARKRGLLWLTALLAVGGAGATLVAIQFTRPIAALQSSFHKVEAGDLQTRASVTRNDEIGALTHSFNEMVERLQSTRAVEARLAEAERLAALGRLAAGVAHEVRNPLNAILLNVDQMRDRVGGSLQSGDRRSFDAYCATVSGEIVRLERLVSTFLDLARAGSIEVQRIDAVIGLRESVALFGPEAQRHGVHLGLQAQAPILINADPSRLPTVWNNLLSNALAATSEGGHVEVTAALEGAGPGDAGSELHVTIGDDGSGISPEELARVWDPFYTGRPGGTGLGLSIVRGTVERHGGRVTMESELGRGTRVHVWLPCRQARPPSLPPAPQES